MPTKVNAQRISEATLAQQWFSFLHGALGELQSAFRRINKTKGLTQKDIGAKLGMDPARVSKCLRGRTNMTLRTMHNLARAMDCRLVISLQELGSLRPTNRPPTIANQIEKVTPTGSSGGTMIVSASNG